MQSKFKRLGKDSLVYGIGGVATRFIGFLLLPIYTRVFSPADYGIMDVVATMTALGVIILTAGSETALSYYFFQLSNVAERRKTVTSTGVYLVVVNTLVAAVVWLTAEQIAWLTFGEGTPAIYLRVAVLSIPFSGLLGLNLNLFRLDRRPWSYIAISTSQVLFTLLLNMYLVVVLGVGIIGVFWTNLLASLLFAIVTTMLNRRYFAIQAFAWARLGEVVRYGLPLVIGGLSLWAINYLDRYFLLRFATLEDVGLYSVGVRLASAVAFVTWAFRLANAPFQFEISSEPDAPQIYSRTLSYFMLVVTMLCVLLALFARPVLRIVTTEAYVNAYPIVGLAAFSAAAYGLYQIVGVGLLVTKKTGFTGMVIGIGALLNVGFLSIFVPWFGMVGAGLAVLLTHVCVLIILYRRAQQVYPIPYNLGLVSRVLIPAGIVLLLGTLIVPIDFWADILISSGLFLGFLILLVTLRAFDLELRRLLQARLRGVVSLVVKHTRIAG